MPAIPVRSVTLWERAMPAIVYKLTNKIAGMARSYSREKL